MFQKSFSRPLPEGSVILPGGKKARIPGGKTVSVNKKGRWVQKTATWYTKDSSGKVVSLGDDKDTAREMELTLKLRATQAARGVELTPAVPLVEELAPLVEAWIAEQTRAGRHKVRVSVDRARVTKALAAAGLVTLADLSRQEAGQALQDAISGLQTPAEAPRLPKGETFSPAQLRAALEVTAGAVWKAAKLRGISGTGEGRKKRYTRAEAEAILQTRRGGISPVTANNFRVAVGTFCRWLVRRGNLQKVPYLGRKSDEKTGRRLVRRALAWAEVEKLAQETAAGGATRGGMPAESRSLLWLVAVTTTLRKRALGELTPADFHLEDPTPWISVRGETDKTGKSRTCPVPSAIASRLAALLKGLPKTRPVWPIPAGIAGILRADLLAAGIPPKTEDGVVDLHALRHAGITRMMAAGVSPVVVARVAGHSDTRQILQRYGHLSPENLAELTRGAWQ